jgi:putative ABC transport system permease protein
VGTLLQDLRYGFRLLRKRPGFTFVTVLTLALGIGANTAIFSVVNATLLKPLPYGQPERVMTIWQNDLKGGVEREDVSPANFLDYRERNQVFEEMAAIEPYSHSLTGEGEPESFKSWAVTEGFFRTLGANALHGRTFVPEEHQRGNARAVVIGHGLWQRRFGGDPSLVGRQFILNGQPHTVVGVMPPEFQYPEGREMWVPRYALAGDAQMRGTTYLRAVGRLKSGVTPEQARADMTRVAEALGREYPQTNGAMGVTVVPLPEQLTGHIRPALMALLAAVGLVLLIACANVANLLLARGLEREREFAVRTALGAGRARLVRQLVTESFVLALAGGAAGVLLSRWIIDLILAFTPEGLLGARQVVVDARVLAFAAAAAVATSFVFGLLPSLQSSKPNLTGALKEGGRTGAGSLSRHRLRGALVVAEVAMSLVLLVGAGLLIRSFVRLLRVDPGFAAGRIAALEVHVWGKYRTPEERRAFFDDTLSRVSALPGVEAAGAASSLPFIQMDSAAPFTIEGRPAPAPGEEPSAYSITATTDYFRAMNIPLREGRTFQTSDREETTTVAVVNETMARRHWPGESPVGRRFTVDWEGQPVTLEIVGVVGDVRHRGLDAEPRPEFFIPHAQDSSGSMIYVVRTTTDPRALLPSVKSAIWAVNKDIPFDRAVTMEQLMTKSLGERRFTLLLLGSFALLSLVLAGVGLYGLVSFSTSQRTHEIGVRLALGAARRDIFRLVVGQGMLLTFAGVGIGVVAALAATRLISGLLFGVSALDPATYAAVALLLSAVSLLACYLPARRATKVDPMEALRYE